MTEKELLEAEIQDLKDKNNVSIIDKDQEHAEMVAILNNQIEEMMKQVQMKEDENILLNRKLKESQSKFDKLVTENSNMKTESLHEQTKFKVEISTLKEENHKLLETIKKMEANQSKTEL